MVETLEFGPTPMTLPPSSRGPEDRATRTCRSPSPWPATTASCIQVRVPAELDVTRCQLGGALVPFMVPGGSHTTVFPGWSYRIWAFDVHGERLVIMAANGPEVTASERAELTRMVETLTFVDAPTS